MQRDSHAIYFYSKSDDYFLLSNFGYAPFYWNNKLCRTVEHPYQAAKYSDYPEYQEKIMNIKTPADACRLGQTDEYSIRSDWSEVKLNIMRELLYEKFTQNEDLKELLLETGNSTLIEDSGSNYYWGCGKNGTGKNWLGVLLMELRDKLRVKN
jgi:ribA/ribD-fused uncharacterized protein